MEEDWCPNGTELLRDGAHCANDPCNDEDKATCCVVAATKKKMAYYRKLGCTPTPSTDCSNQMCYFDDSCLWEPPRKGGLGCFAAGISASCRFCGFGVYEECPKSYNCEGNCHAWSQEHQDWCFKNYDVRCTKTLHHVEFWRNQTIAGLVAVTDQIVDALGSANTQHLGVVAAFGLAAVVAVAAIVGIVWRVAYRRRSSGPHARMLVLDMEEADFIE